MNKENQTSLTPHLWACVSMSNSKHLVFLGKWLQKQTEQKIGLTTGTHDMKVFADNEHSLLSN